MLSHLEESEGISDLSNILLTTEKHKTMKLKVTTVYGVATSIALVCRLCPWFTLPGYPVQPELGKNISRDRACYVNLTRSIHRCSSITLSSFSPISLYARRTNLWMRTGETIGVHRWKFTWTRALASREGTRRVECKKSSSGATECTYGSLGAN